MDNPLEEPVAKAKLKIRSRVARRSSRSPSVYSNPTYTSSEGGKSPPRGATFNNPIYDTPEGSPRAVKDAARTPKPQSYRSAGAPSYHRRTRTPLRDPKARQASRKLSRNTTDTSQQRESSSRRLPSRSRNSTWTPNSQPSSWVPPDESNAPNFLLASRMGTAAPALPSSDDNTRHDNTSSSRISAGSPPSTTRSATSESAPSRRGRGSAESAGPARQARSSSTGRGQQSGQPETPGGLQGSDWESYRRARRQQQTAKEDR